jgi:hypothetical protein
MNRVWGAFIPTVFRRPDLARRLDSLSRLLDWRWLRQVEFKRRIQRAAEARGIAWQLVRQGGRHEVWRCGSTKVTIPRHREVNELTSEAIFKSLEGELGRAWWRK